jgi:hypothetical protein
MSGIFAMWQAAYAERGIATFPVGNAKKPAVKRWQRIGLKGSTVLATKFQDADAFGYVTGRRSDVTVLDIDTTDERIADDAIQRHGLPVIVIRTASGKRHFLYKYGGERRRIRPFRELPIDILGDNGYAIAPPSKLNNGSYEIIHGHFDDLDRLVPLVGIDIAETPPPSPAALAIPTGQRNASLWRHCMRQARGCNNFEALVNIARAFNESCSPPLGDTEVMATARSAWRYETEGNNRFGQRGAFFPTQEIVSMVPDQDAFFLLAFLRANQGPTATFMCANGLTETFGWHRLRLANARRRLLELGYIRAIRQAGRGAPALFRWVRDRPPFGKRVSEI